MKAIHYRPLPRTGQRLLRFVCKWAEGRGASSQGSYVKESKVPPPIPSMPPNKERRGLDPYWFAYWMFEDLINIVQIHQLPLKVQREVEGVLGVGEGHDEGVTLSRHLLTSERLEELSDE